jgi:hypothetical protein
LISEPNPARFALPPTFGLKAAPKIYLLEEILESRGEAVRHNVKRVRRYVRQSLLRHSNINPNN